MSDGADTVERCTVVTSSPGTDDLGGLCSLDLVGFECITTTEKAYCFPEAPTIV